MGVDGFSSVACISVYFIICDDQCIYTSRPPVCSVWGAIASAFSSCSHCLSLSTLFELTLNLISSYDWTLITAPISSAGGTGTDVSSGLSHSVEVSSVQAAALDSGGPNAQIACFYR